MVSSFWSHSQGLMQRIKDFRKYSLFPQSILLIWSIHISTNEYFLQVEWMVCFKHPPSPFGSVKTGIFYEQCDFATFFACQECTRALPLYRIWKIDESCSQKVNRTETDRLKSKPVFNLKPFSGFSSRWSRNIVEDFKSMGKTDHDHHQIDKTHYCSVTFSKIMSGNRLISTTKPLYDWRKWTLGVQFKQIDTNRMKNMSQNWV